MQRLARHLLKDTNSEAIDLLANYDEIVSLLNKHLPPSTSNLMARPVIKENNTIVEWYTQLEGQAKHVDMTNKKVKLDENIDKLIKDRLTAIERLRVALLSSKQISERESDLLKRFVEGASHNSKQLYIINNEPVITGWGIGLPEPKAVVSTKPRWCLWLLPLLLLLLLLLGLLWYFFYKPTIEPPVTPPVVVEEPKKEEPKPECKISYQAGEKPEMVIIFDDSGSMGASLLETPQSISDFYERWNLVGLISKAEVAYFEREPTRLTAAKTASANIIDKIDPNIDIGLIALKKCPEALNYGFYSTNRRSQLLSKINSMKPYKDSGGTALYNSLEQVAKMVDGVNKDAFILLLSDGEDSCESRNICELGQRLAAEKPRLKINIVDITGAKAANCVAEATGGTVFTANNKEELAEMVNQAVKPMTEINSCDTQDVPSVQ